MALMCIFTCMLSKAQNATVALHHEGDVTMYDGEKLQEALNVAVDGDTLFLSEGAFIGSDTIKSGVAIIGAGTKTRIVGNIVVGEYSGTIEKCSLSLLTLESTSSSSSGNGDVLIGMPKDFTIFQCKFNNLTTRTISATHRFNTVNVTVVSCNCSSIPFLFLQSLNIMASKIKSAVVGLNTSTYSNCNIGSVTVNQNGAIFNNCVLGSATSSATYSGCLIKGNADSFSTAYGCWFTDEEVLNEDLDCIYSNIANCVDDNNVMVGVMGGATKYSLQASTPRVTEHSLTVDNAKKVLNVTLKVGVE